MPAKAFVLLTVALPVGQLVLGSFFKFFGFYRREMLTLQHYRDVWESRLIFRALSNTVLLGFAGARLRAPHGIVESGHLRRRRCPYLGRPRGHRLVSERLEAGVIESTEGKGSVPSESDLSLGAVLWPDGPLRRHFAAADAILAVGTRLALARPRPEQQVIQIEIDPEEMGRNHEKTFPLLGDAKATLEELVARLSPRESRKSERERLRAEVAATADQEPQATILKSLRAAAPRETILVPDMTQIGYYSRPFWPVYEGRTYLSSSYSQNLGFAYPTALGAKVARPDRPVLALCGDGGFLYNAQELATAVQCGLHVVVVVFNDDSYGNVARDLDESFGGS